MKAICSITFLLFSFSLLAQISTSSQWTWVKGDNNIDIAGVYGTQGTASSTNKPGARKGAVSWTDATGNMWLFGGLGYANTNGYLNDLWKYNPAANQWTWVKGNNTAENSGVYGTPGIADPANKPGGRMDSYSWIDAAGNLWVFGGQGYDENHNLGRLSDLWKYSPASNQWTWISGDYYANALPEYGTQGVASIYNIPGARSGTGSWTDASGNLWLFGGLGYGENGSGGLNDIWKYNPATDEWTWVKGDKLVAVHGVYGTQGIAAAANNPCTRYGSISAKDASGNVWLFGGFTVQASGGQFTTYGELNDLWKYNSTSNQWTWVKGDSSVNKPAVYGTLGTAAAANNPGSRENASMWIDASGKVWLFGGYGYALNDYAELNDLWKYDPAINQWTWVKGDNTLNSTGIYGTQGTPSSSNKPGARESPVSWRDAAGNFWLLGGLGYGVSSQGRLNDLWKLSVASASSYYFRTITSGNWNAPVTWECSPVADFSSGVISPSAISPDLNASAITIRSLHTVTVTANVTIRQTTITTGGKLVVSPGIAVTVK